MKMFAVRATKMDCVRGMGVLCGLLLFGFVDNVVVLAELPVFWSGRFCVKTRYEGLGARC